MSKANSPMRCFEGEAQPYEPFWKLVDAADGGQPVIELDGYISEFSWYEDDITPQKFKSDLEKHGGGGPVTIKLHSYGGDVIAASRMHNIIREYPGEVTVQIDGIAASAATVVAVAGDRVQINETAYFMIHDPLMIFFLAALNIEEMTRLADSLKAVKEGIINAYETKTGLSRERLSKLMTNETWMSANEAASLGFVDEVVTTGIKTPPAAKNTAVVNALMNYTNVPPALLQALTEMPGEKAATSAPQLSEGEEREAQELREQVEKILGKEKEDA